MQLKNVLDIFISRTIQEILAENFSIQSAAKNVVLYIYDINLT